MTSLALRWLAAALDLGIACHYFWLVCFAKYPRGENEINRWADVLCGVLWTFTFAITLLGLELR